MDEPDDSPDFEEALSELEQLVQQMEEGKLTLEESLQAFEKGIRLTRFCQSALRNAEQRVTILQEENGDISDSPIALEESSDVQEDQDDETI